jgi:hypothetical protein
MTRVAMTIFSMVATTLMGIGVIAVLVMGYVSAQAIVAAALVGLVLALPVTWAVARAIT